MKKNKYIGWFFFMICSILFVLLMNYVLPKMGQTTQKQHNFQVGDDTEHLWKGDNGIEFYE